MVGSPELEEGRTFDVFVSHAAKDRAPAMRVARVLEKYGYRCFVAAESLHAIVGTSQWSEALETLLSRTPVLVVIVTEHALASQWVTFEWRSFHEAILSGRRAGLLVPLLSTSLEIDRLPTALRHWQAVGGSRHAGTRAHRDLVELIDGFRAASLSKTPPIGLYWTSTSHQSSERRQSIDPSTTDAVAPVSRWRPSGWSRVTRVALVAFSVALVAASWSLFERSRRSLPVKSIQKYVPSRTTAGPVEPEATNEPKLGWEPIGAYIHPTLENRVLIARVETWEQAVQAFRQRCAVQCTDRQRAAAYFAEGETAMLSGNLSAARTAFERARQVEPAWTLSTVGLAATFVDSDPSRALDTAREAFLEDPTLWIALIVKGAAYTTQRKFVNAIQELIEARRRAPADCRSGIDGLLAGTYHAEGALDDKAVRLAARECTPEQGVAAACLVLAEQSLEHHQPNSAIRYAELADRDDSVPLMLALGDAFQMKGDLKKAWGLWRRAVTLHERAREQGAPPVRMAAIEQAVASGKTPPPRIPERSVPKQSIGPPHAVSDEGGESHNPLELKPY